MAQVSIEEHVPKIRGLLFLWLAHGQFLNWYLSNCFPPEEYSRLALGLKTQRLQQINRD